MGALTLTAYRYKLAMHPSPLNISYREGVIFEKDGRFAEGPLSFAQSFLESHWRGAIVQSAYLLFGSFEMMLKQIKAWNGLPRVVKIKLSKINKKELLKLYDLLKLPLRLDAEGLPFDLPANLPCEFIEDLPHPSIYPCAADFHAIENADYFIWKASQRALQPCKKFVISSFFESDLGLCQLAHLAKSLGVENEPQGLGTLPFFKEHLLLEPPILKNGELICPKELKIDRSKLLPL